MRAMVVVLLVGLFAGCTDPGADAPEPTGPAPGSEPVVPERYEASFRLLANDTAVLDRHLLSTQESDNCVLLGAPVTIVGGTATVSWASDPTMPAMDLVLYVAGELHSFASGEAPLALDLAGITLGKDDQALLSWQVSQDAGAGAAVLREGTLELTFDYLPGPGFLRLAADDGWTCVVSR